MGRRLRTDEIAIGSDSFLDIIANMVGILIILIVVAGLRVSHSPPPKLALRMEREDSGSPEPVAAPEVAEPAETIAAVPVEPVFVEPEENPQLEELPEELPYEPSPELLGRIQKLEAEIRGLEKSRGDAEAALAEVRTRQQLEQQRMVSAEKLLATQSEDLDQRQRSLNQLSSDLFAKREQRERLHAAWVKLANTQPNVKKLQHKVTPMSRAVQGEEMHFRLSQSRIARVPLQDLVERLVNQAKRQKDWLAKFHQHQGMVGPIGGFSMQYIVERQGPMVSVTGFKIIPENDLKAETAEEAARLGSNFHQALQSAKPGSTLTFWVYPDSFPMFRQMQAIAHESGFNVAARPIPFGVPISGSPNGSRSAAQ